MNIWEIFGWFLSAALQQESNTSTLLLSVLSITKSVLQTEGNPCRGLSELSSYSETAGDTLHRTFLLLNVLSNSMDSVFLAVVLVQCLQGQDDGTQFFGWVPRSHAE